MQETAIAITAVNSGVSVFNQFQQKRIPTLHVSWLSNGSRELVFEDSASNIALKSNPFILKDSQLELFLINR
jgi:hypothetical protein